MPHYASYGVSGPCSRVNTHTAPFANSYAYPMHTMYQHDGYDNHRSCDPDYLEGPPVRKSGSSTKALNTPRFHGGYFKSPGPMCACGDPSDCSCGSYQSSCSCGAKAPVRAHTDSPSCSSQPAPLQTCGQPMKFHYYGAPTCSSYAAHY